MRPNFHPLYGLAILLFLSSFTLALDKKRTSATADAAAKTKTKAIQKVDPKQQAKTSRQPGKKDDENKQQLARKKGKDGNEKHEKKSDKDVSRLAAKSRESDSRKAAKPAKLEAEKKTDKAKDKSAQWEHDKKADKKEVAAKQTEKAAKSLAKTETKAELAAAKIKPAAKLSKQESQREALTQLADNKRAKRDLSADHSNALAKLEVKAKSDPKSELRSQIKEETAKDLPAVKFPLRPIAKVIPKVELKFSVARAVSGTSFDAPPPQDYGPDVIDVIEHDSPEAVRLNEVLRADVKTVQLSGIPGHSRKKMDVGKMDLERIKQIQEALAKKGYYVGEINGQYDDLTIDAMRRFQETHKIDVTGYATAQSLRLLGLTDW